MAWAPSMSCIAREDGLPCHCGTITNRAIPSSSLTATRTRNGQRHGARRCLRPFAVDGRDLRRVRSRRARRSRPCAGAAPALSAARRASTSVSSPMSSRLLNCASRLDAASSCLPAASASWRRTLSSKRPSSLVGSSTSIDLTASCTLICASAVLARASSSLRLLFSCSSFCFMPLRPSLSLSTTSVCDSMVGSTAFASRSELIWRCSAILARLSNLSASAVLPRRAAGRPSCWRREPCCPTRWLPGGLPRGRARAGAGCRSSRRSPTRRRRCCSCSRGRAGRASSGGPRRSRASS